MPSWGRPSWGRNGGSSRKDSDNTRRRQEWERQQKEWESSRRFEELDSESDNDEGVDIGYRSRDYALEDEENSDDDYDGQDDMQIAMRDKEVVLADRAMARIRRAQELGKENVKLTPAESDALERRMARDRAKGRKPIIETERLQPKKVKRQSLPAVTASSSSSAPRRSNRSSFCQEDSYIDKPRSRKTSSQNLQQAQQQQPPRRRQLPDDLDWRPRALSSSTPQQQVLPYPVSPQEIYQYSYPLPPAIYHARPSRHVSGPAGINYPQITPYPIDIPNHRSAYASHSDPALNRRIISSSSNPTRRRDLEPAGDDDYNDDDDDDDEDDETDQGVQVDVIHSSSLGTQGYEFVSRNQGSGISGGGNGGGRASQTSSLGRRRGSRR